MITTIDRAGRIVIPKEIRTAVKLSAGIKLDIRLRNGVIEIQPAPAKIQMEKRGKFIVAVPTDRELQLTEDVVNETIGQVRSRQI